MNRRIHIDARYLISGVLALVAAITVMALTTPVDRLAVLVAADSLSPGVRIADLQIGEQLVEPMPGLIAAADRSTLADRTLAVPVAAGSPILESMLAATDTTTDVLAVTLELGNAVQGDLRAGDLVDVYASDDQGTRVIATSVPIVAAAVGSGGLGGNDVAVLLAVDRELASSILGGMHAGSIDLVRRGR